MYLITIQLYCCSVKAATYKQVSMAVFPLFKDIENFEFHITSTCHKFGFFLLFSTM